MVSARDYNDEGVIRLGVKCIEQMTDEYLSKHNGADLWSYKHFLLKQLTYNHWLRSAIDPEEVIGCMERVRQEKLRTDKDYQSEWQD